MRKKAVLCMHSFLCKAPDLLRHAQHHFKSALCDKDPGVMWASLHVFYDLVQVLAFNVILISILVIEITWYIDEIMSISSVHFVFF